MHSRISQGWPCKNQILLGHLGATRRTVAFSLLTVSKKAGSSGIGGKVYKSALGHSLARASTPSGPLPRWRENHRGAMSHPCQGKENDLGYPKAIPNALYHLRVESILMGADPPSREGPLPSSPLQEGEQPGGTINASVPKAAAAERLCGVTPGTEAHPGSSGTPLLTFRRCAQEHVCSGAQG
ncbi:UNVERIFIED_CONTAM: hypothetical protein FKN15_032352 [Acipenser sinensis]